MFPGRLSDVANLSVIGSADAQLTHRFIHIASAARNECWKKNNLERNAEMAVMIQNTTRCFRSGVRDQRRFDERH